MINNITPIYEFSTGINYQIDPKEPGGWVSTGFIVGEYMNMTYPQGVPHEIERAISNQLFDIKAGGVINQPAIIGRVVPGSSDWSVVALVSRGRDNKGRPLTVHRYFFCAGKLNLWKILAWIGEFRHNNHGEWPIFNPTEKKVVGQYYTAPDKASTSYQLTQEDKEWLSQQDTPILLPYNNVDTPLDTIFKLALQKAFQQWQEPDQKIKEAKNNIAIANQDIQQLEQDIQQRQAYIQQLQQDSQQLEQDIQQQQGYIQQLEQEIRQQQGYIQQLAQDIQQWENAKYPVAFAYNAEVLEKPQQFTLIHVASENAYQRIKNMIDTPVQVLAPVGFDEQKVKAAIKTLMTKIDRKSIQDLAEVIDNNSIQESWHLWFNAQGAIKGIKQPISSEPMARLLTLRAMIIPETLPQLLNWLSRPDHQKFQNSSLELQNRFFHDFLPDKQETLQAKLAEGIEVLLPQIFAAEVSPIIINQLLTERASAWSHCREELIKNIEADLIVIAQQHPYLQRQLEGNISVQNNFNCHESLWIPIIQNWHHFRYSNQNYPSWFSPLMRNISAYFTNLNNKILLGYKPFAELFENLATQKSEGYTVSAYATKEYQISAYFYQISQGKVSTYLFEKAFGNKELTRVYLGIKINRKVTILEIILLILLIIIQFFIQGLFTVLQWIWNIIKLPVTIFKLLTQTQAAARQKRGLAKDWSAYLIIFLILLFSSLLTAKFMGYDFPLNPDEAKVPTQNQPKKEITQAQIDEALNQFSATNYNSIYYLKKEIYQEILGDPKLLEKVKTRYKNESSASDDYPRFGDLIIDKLKTTLGNKKLSEPKYMDKEQLDKDQNEKDNYILWIKAIYQYQRDKLTSESDTPDGIMIYKKETFNRLKAEVKQQVINQLNVN
jgi:hypothetical protein